MITDVLSGSLLALLACADEELPLDSRDHRKLACAASDSAIILSAFQRRLTREDCQRS